MLKFSANLSLLFTELPLIERFAAARHSGFSAVEIQFPYELSIEAIAAELEHWELELVLINLPVGDLMQGGNGLAGVPGQEQAFRRAVLEALPYAQRLGVRCVNVLAGRQPSDADLVHCLHTLSANARYAAEAFQSIDVTTTLEAINSFDMPGFLVSNIAQMQEILEAVDHPTLKMQFDLYHLARMGDDVIVGLMENAAHIGHIQFADAPGRGAPGTGKLPLKGLFEVIEMLPYTGWTGAEYRPGEAGTEASLEWFKAYR